MKNKKAAPAMIVKPIRIPATMIEQGTKAAKRLSTKTEPLDFSSFARLAIQEKIDRVLKVYPKLRKGQQAKVTATTKGTTVKKLSVKSPVEKAKEKAKKAPVKSMTEQQATKRQRTKKSTPPPMNLPGAGVTLEKVNKKVKTQAKKLSKKS